GLKVEIQTRSILQHAWAEIEHDIGYKRASGLPSAFQRRFSRLAGLLEMADQEFVSINSELRKYRLTLWGEIKASPGSVSIDSLSLEVIAQKHSSSIELDKEIASAIGININPAEKPTLERSAHIL